MTQLPVRPADLTCWFPTFFQQPSNQLDQQLEGLAHLYPGTLFMRVLVGRRSPLLACLGLPAAPGEALLKSYEMFVEMFSLLVISVSSNFPRSTGLFSGWSSSGTDKPAYVGAA